MVSRVFVALCVALCVTSAFFPVAYALQYPQGQRQQQVSDVAVGSPGSNALKCEGKLRAMKADYTRDQAARNKELALIKAIRRMAAELNGVKDVADVETSRRHTEINGRNGVLEIINSMYNKVIADQQAQLKSISRQQALCKAACSNGVSALKRVYDSRQKTVNARSATLNSRIRTVAAYRTKIAEAKGALSNAQKHRSKQSALLQKELKLVNLLLHHVGQLGSSSTTTDVALPQPNMDELKQIAESSGEFHAVLEMLSVPKQDVNKLRKLLINLKNKILRELAALNTQVKGAKSRISSLQSNLSKALTARDSAQRALNSARSSRDVARNAWKTETRRCRNSASQADVEVDVQESSSTEDAMLKELHTILNNSQDERLQKLSQQLSGTADVQSSDDSAAMLAALLGALQGGNQKVGADLSKLLGALGSTDDAEDSATDVQDSGSDEALLTGLLGALEGDKKDGADMAKLLGALTGATEEDDSQDDLQQDDAATEELVQDDAATEDNEQDMDSMLVRLLDALDNQHVSDDDMNKVMQSISNLQTSEGAVTHKDIEKIVKLANKTNNLKKIEEALKALEKK